MPAPGAPRPHFVARDGTLRDRFSARRLTDFQDYQWCREKFQPQAAGVNPPDVFQNTVTFLRKYDKRGIILDLKPRFRQVI